MRSLIDMLKPVRTALVSVSDNVGYHTANDATKTYIVYSEEGEGGQVSADNKKAIQSVSGSIDLYALAADLSLFDEVQKALNEAGVSFYLNSVQREETNHLRFVHYEWLFEVS